MGTQPKVIYKIFPLFDNADSYLLQSKNKRLNLSIDFVKCIKFDDGGEDGGGGG